MRVKLLLATLSLVALVGPSKAATWNVMTLLRGASEVTYFDADTVNRRDGDVRIQIERIRDLDANRHEEIYKTQEWRTYHCSARTLSVGQIFEYDRQGQVSRRLSDPEATAVAPYDFELKTLADICAATFPKTATHDAFERVRGNDPEVDAYRYFEKARAEITAHWPWPSARLPPERVDCSQMHFQYAATLSDLPPELRVVAHTGRMADRGRDFNSTDVTDRDSRISATQERPLEITAPLSLSSKAASSPTRRSGHWKRAAPVGTAKSLGTPELRPIRSLDCYLAPACSGPYTRR